MLHEDIVKNLSFYSLEAVGRRRQLESVDVTLLKERLRDLLSQAEAHGEAICLLPGPCHEAARSVLDALGWSGRFSTFQVRSQVAFCLALDKFTSWSIRRRDNVVVSSSGTAYPLEESCEPS